MRKNLFSLFVGLSFCALQAQETVPDDAIRLAVDNINGTARYRSMGGAFGALGGDLSAINQNPAGSLFFNNNYATATLSNSNTKNSSLYFGTRTNDNDNSFDLNQAGVVFIFTDSNSSKNDWKKLAVSFNYENTNNFNNSIFSAGINPYNSIGNYFVNFAQGFNETDLSNSYYTDFGFDGQQAYLGYQAYLFDPVTSSTYTSNVPAAHYYQDNYLTTTGYNGKLIGNFAAQYKDVLFLGFNINAHFTDYVRTTSLYEQNDNPIANKVYSIQFDNELHTFGSGISFNLGAIVKIVPQFRVGLAYESPTWYRLNDELSQRVISYINNADSSTSRYVIDPQITNVYDAYKIQTPSKWTGSMAYIFGKKGLLSVDVSTKDYSTTRFKPKNVSPYQDLNIYLSNALDKAIEVRVGGEYKIKQVSLRGGYHFDQSPYKVDQKFGDLTGYSGGIGYSFGDSRLDLAYSYEHRKMNQELISSGMPDQARISRYNNNVTLSYSMNF